MTLKGKTCKNKTYKGDLREFFCLTHIKKLTRMNKTLHKDFLSRCLMMYNSIRNRGIINSRLENHRLYIEKQRKKNAQYASYLRCQRWRHHSSDLHRGTFNYANIILQHPDPQILSDIVSEFVD
jgi:hypothetical protein